jgi:hypothetical protein
VHKKVWVSIEEYEKLTKGKPLEVIVEAKGYSPVIATITIVNEKGQVKSNG